MAYGQDHHQSQTKNNELNPGVVSPHAPGVKSTMREGRIEDPPTIYTNYRLSRNKNGEKVVNCLKIHKQKVVLDLLVEGNSIRGTQRITGVNRRTIIRLIRSTGKQCQQALIERMRNLPCQHVAVDELWSFNFKKKEKLMPDDDVMEKGDQFIFLAHCQDTKLIPTFTVGKRTGQTALTFMEQLRQCIPHRFQLSSDGFKGYIDAVDIVFGADIDWAVLIKHYRENGNGNGSREGYRPSDLKRIEIKVMSGKPDEDKVCTSFVERLNLNLRQNCKRFSRLSIAFSKRLDCLKAAVAIYVWHHNYCRSHHSLHGATPAMVAGIEKTFLTWDEVLS